MEILNEKQFNTRLLTTENTLTPHSRVYINTEKTNAVIAGAILEACIKHNGYYLVFTTDDIPYEDSLQITLLKHDLAIVDHASMSSPYSTGTFKLINASKNNSSVSFRFFGGTDWSVQLLEEEEFFIPYISEPAGTHRQFKFKRHFKISGKPIAENHQ